MARIRGIGPASARASAAAIGLCVALGGVLAAQEASAPPPEAPILPGLKSGWNELDASWISLRLNFQALEDGAFFSQDAASKEQVGDLSATSLFRVDDLTLSGRIKFAHPWSFMVGGNYGASIPPALRAGP